MKECFEIIFHIGNFTSYRQERTKNTISTSAVLLNLPLNIRGKVLLCSLLPTLQPLDGPGA